MTSAAEDPQKNNGNADSVPAPAGDAKPPAPPPLAGTLPGRIARAALRLSAGVAKRGHNDHFQYAFVKDEDMTRACREALLAEGLIVLMEIDNVSQETSESGWTATRLSAFFDVHATDGPAPRMRIRWESEAADKGDKGIPKAITGARKSFLANLLLVPTGEDPEADGKVDQAAQKDEVVRRGPAPSASRVATSKQVDLVRRLHRECIAAGVTIAPLPEGLETMAGNEVSMLIDRLFSVKERAHAKQERGVGTEGAGFERADGGGA